MSLQNKDILNINFGREDLKFMTALEGFDYIISDNKTIKFSKEAENIYAGHVRVSTDEQANEGESIRTQTSLIDEKVIKLNGKLYDYFIEDGKSASKNKISKRPTMLELINGFLEGKYRNIITYDEDRLFRNPNEQLAILAFIARKGGRIYFTNSRNTTGIISEKYGFDAGFEQIVNIIKAIQNKEESKRISARVYDNLHEIAKSGRSTGSIVPIGYKKVGEKFEINKEEEILVKEIEDLYLEGHGFHTIIKYMNGEKTKALGIRDNGRALRPKRRKNDSEYWTDTVLESIIFSWWYAGYIPFDNKKYKSVVHKGIRTEEKHEKIIAKKKEKSTKGKEKNPNPRKNSSPFLLMDLLFCGECQKEFKGRTTPNATKKNYRWYRCNNQDRQDKREVCLNKKRYPKEIIEEFVLQKIKQYLVNYDMDNVYSSILKQTAEKDRTIEIELAKKKKEITEKEKYKKNLMQSIISHENDLELKELDEEGHTEMLKEYKKEQIEILKEIKKLKLEYSLLEEKSNNEQEAKFDTNIIYKKMKEFVETFEKVNMAQKKSLIEEFINKIFVYKNGEIVIEYKLINDEMEKTVKEMAVSKEVVELGMVGDTTNVINTTTEKELETLLNKGFYHLQKENIIAWCNEIYYEARSKFKEFLIGTTLNYTENGRINAWQLSKITGISHYTTRAYFNYSHFPTEEKMIQVLHPYKSEPKDFIRYLNIDNINVEIFFKIINVVNRWNKENKIQEDLILKEIEKRIEVYKEKNTLNRAVIYS